MVANRSPARQLQFPVAPVPQRRGAQPAIVAAVVVLTLAAIAGVWYFAIRADQPPQPANASPLGSAGASPLSPADQTAAGERRSEPASVPRPQERPSSPRGNARSAQRAAITMAPAAASPGVAAPSPARKAGTPVAAPPSVAPPAPARNARADEVLLIAVPKAGEGPVFSAKDEGVTPPALVSPKVNISAPEGETAGDLSTIDLVVSDAGQVESVKLASPVRDYREAMMLSAIKAWRFKPASVDGMPVRYQLRIRVSVTTVAAGSR